MPAGVSAHAGPTCRLKQGQQEAGGALVLLKGIYKKLKDPKVRRAVVREPGGEQELLQGYHQATAACSWAFPRGGAGGDKKSFPSS